MADKTLWPCPLDEELNDSKSRAWEEGGHVHNWQNYIGPGTRSIWYRFDDEIKYALALDADERAGREDWD